MNTIYNEIQKEFGITKPMPASEISEMVNAWAVLPKSEQVKYLSRREGFILE
jgi:hypothetical protein